MFELLLAALWAGCFLLCLEPVLEAGVTEVLSTAFSEVGIMKNSSADITVESLRHWTSKLEVIATKLSLIRDICYSHSDLEWRSVRLMSKKHNTKTQQNILRHYPIPIPLFFYSLWTVLERFSYQCCPPNCGWVCPCYWLTLILHQQNLFHILTNITNSTSSGHHLCMLISYHLFHTYFSPSYDDSFRRLHGETSKSSFLKEDKTGGWLGMQ